MAGVELQRSHDPAMWRPPQSGQAEGARVPQWPKAKKQWQLTQRTCCSVAPTAWPVPVCGVASSCLCSGISLDCATADQNPPPTSMSQKEKWLSYKMIRLNGQGWGGRGRFQARWSQGAPGHQPPLSSKHGLALLRLPRGGQ